MWCLDNFQIGCLWGTTGRKIKKQNVYAFGKKIYSSENKNTFKNYTISSKVENLVSFLLPLKIETIVLEETQKTIKKINFEQEKQKYINKLKQIAFLGAGEYDIIVDENQTIISDGKKHTITYVLTLRKKVC